MKWTVQNTSKAGRQIQKLPDYVRAAYVALALEMENEGPYRSNWGHFGKLQGNLYHCHIVSGRPTYVACWEVVDKKIRLIEVYYVGTHASAPY